jgi:hypothetical protein
MGGRCQSFSLQGCCSVAGAGRSSCFAAARRRPPPGRPGLAAPQLCVPGLASPACPPSAACTPARVRWRGVHRDAWQWTVAAIAALHRPPGGGRAWRAGGSVAPGSCAFCERARRGAAAWAAPRRGPRATPATARPSLCDDGARCTTSARRGGEKGIRTLRGGAVGGRRGGRGCGTALSVGRRACCCPPAALPPCPPSAAPSLWRASQLRRAARRCRQPRVRLRRDDAAAARARRRAWRMGTAAGRAARATWRCAAKLALPTSLRSAPAATQGAGSCCPPPALSSLSSSPSRPAFVMVNIAAPRPLSIPSTRDAAASPPLSARRVLRPSPPPSRAASAKVAPSGSGCPLAGATSMHLAGGRAAWRESCCMSLLSVLSPSHGQCSSSGRVGSAVALRPSSASPCRLRLAPAWLALAAPGRSRTPGGSGCRGITAGDGEDAGRLPPSVPTCSPREARAHELAGLGHCVLLGAGRADRLPAREGMYARFPSLRRASFAPGRLAHFAALRQQTDGRGRGNLRGREVRSRLPLGSEVQLFRSLRSNWPK